MKRTLMVVAVLALASVGAARAQQPDGATIYGRNCASCHGPKGTPAAGMVHAMAGIPDFAAASMASIPDSVLKAVVANGKGPMMRAYKTTLSPDQVAAVVAYIRTLSRH